MDRNFILTVFILFFIVTGILFYKSSEAKEKLQREEKRFYEIEKSVKEIVYLKKIYENKNYVQNFIKKLQYLKKAKYIKDKKDYIELYFESLSAKVLDKFVQKLINSYINIKEIEISKEDKNCSLRLEIAK